MYHTVTGCFVGSCLAAVSMMTNILSTFLDKVCRRPSSILQIPNQRRITMSTAKKPVVIGGKLKFKGSSSQAPSSSGSAAAKSSNGNGVGSSADRAIAGKKRPLEITPDDVIKDNVVVGESVRLTDAQKKARERQRTLEEQQFKKLAAKPYRERVEEYNMKLSKLTEHNDIPRVSAAGNG